MIPAAAMLMLLPGLIVLRAPLWLSVPASIAFWLLAWDASVVGALDRSPVLRSLLLASGALALVGVPRLGWRRLATAALVLALCALVVLVSGPAGPPPDPTAPPAAAGAVTGSSRAVTAVHLLVWRDGVPLSWVPLGGGSGPVVPGGTVALAADSLLLSEGSSARAALLLAGLAATLAFVAACCAGSPQGREIALGLVLASGSVVVALGTLAVDVLMGVALALAALRLAREHAGPASSFGGAVLLAAALRADPAALLPWVVLSPSGPRARVARISIGALLLSLPWMLALVARGVVPVRTPADVSAPWLVVVIALTAGAGALAGAPWRSLALPLVGSLVLVPLHGAASLALVLAGAFVVARAEPSRSPGRRQPDAGHIV